MSRLVVTCVDDYMNILYCTSYKSLYQFCCIQFVFVTKRENKAFFT